MREERVVLVADGDVYNTQSEDDARQEYADELLRNKPKPKVSGPRRPRVSEDDFIRVYTASNSPQEAATKLGMSLASLTVRASNLRKKGKLGKEFKRGRKKKKGDTPLETPEKE